jgi:hypothetical protein
MTELETLLLTSLPSFGQFGTTDGGNGVHNCVHDLQKLKFNLSSSFYSSVFHYSNSLMPPSLEILHLSGVTTVFQYNENSSFAKFNRNLTGTAHEKLDF